MSDAEIKQGDEGGRSPSTWWQSVSKHHPRSWRECALWFLLAFTAYQLPGGSSWWVALVLGVISVLAFFDERRKVVSNDE